MQYYDYSRTVTEFPSAVGYILFDLLKQVPFQQFCQTRNNLNIHQDF